MVVGDVMDGIAGAFLTWEESLSMCIIIDGWYFRYDYDMFLQRDWLRCVVDSESGEADKVWPTGGPTNHH